MSLKVKISKDQLQSGRLLPNGWYSADVVDVAEDTDKNGATMYIPEIKVTGHPEYAGVTIRSWMCPEWFGGGDLIRRFIEALIGRKYNPDEVFDFEAAKGKSLKFFNKQGDNNGKPVNGIVDWAHKDAKV